MPSRMASASETVPITTRALGRTEQRHEQCRQHGCIGKEPLEAEGDYHPAHQLIGRMRWSSMRCVVMTKPPPSPQMSMPAITKA